MTGRSGGFVCCDVGDSALCHSDLNVRGWVSLIRPSSPQKSPLNYLIHFQGKGHSSGYYYLYSPLLTQQQVQPGSAETPSDGFQGLCRKYFCAWALKNTVTVSLSCDVILRASVMYIGGQFRSSRQSCTNCSSWSRGLFFRTVTQRKNIVQLECWWCFFFCSFFFAIFEQHWEKKVHFAATADSRWISL